MNYIEFMEAKRYRLLARLHELHHASDHRNLTPGELAELWLYKCRIRDLTIALQVLHQIDNEVELEQSEPQEASDETG